MYLLRRWAIELHILERETRVLILELYRNPAYYNSQAYENTLSIIERIINLLLRAIKTCRQHTKKRLGFSCQSYSLRKYFGDP